MRKYLFWIFFLFGCKAFITPEQLALNNVCLELNDTIKRAWKYDSVEQHYRFSPNNGFLDELNRKNNRFRQCMESKDTTYIVKLLGKHFRLELLPANEKYTQRIVYMLTRYPCLGSCEDYDCQSLYIYFNEKGKVLYVMFEAVTCGSYD